MPRARYTRAPTTLIGATPFLDAEEAWFWSLRCQKARDQGMRFVRDMAPVARPCYPDDIFRAVKRLSESRSLSRGHLTVLRKFGALERPPDPRCEEEAGASRLWTQALDHLAAVLKAKEIIR